MVVVAQLVRASDCDSEGRGFEPPRLPKPKPLKRVSVFLCFYFFFQSNDTYFFTGMNYKKLNNNNNFKILNKYSI